MAETMGKVKLYVTWPIILEIKYPKHVRYFPISWLTYVNMFVCVCVYVWMCVCTRVYVFM